MKSALVVFEALVFSASTLNAAPFIIEKSSENTQNTKRFVEQIKWRC